jgi:hypothetical protein
MFTRKLAIGLMPTSQKKGPLQLPSICCQYWAKPELWPWANGLRFVMENGTKTQSSAIE